MLKLIFIFILLLFTSCSSTVGFYKPFNLYVGKYNTLKYDVCIRKPEEKSDLLHYERYILEINNDKFLNSCVDTNLSIVCLYSGDSVYIADVKIYHGFDSGDSYYAIGYFLDESNKKIKFEYKWPEYNDSLYKSVWDDSLVQERRFISKTKI